jgi:hypothetical protein
MAHEDEMLRVLREIQAELQQHHDEWREMMDRSLERQRLAQERLQKIQRGHRLTMVVLAAILLIVFLIPTLSWAVRWGLWNLAR